MTAQPYDGIRDSVERAKVLRRLVDFGFSEEQAWALATSGPDTLFVVPAPAVTS